MSLVGSVVGDTAGVRSIADATAEQWDIKNGKTAYIPSGKVTGSGYFPAMMEFDGSTGYYSATITTSGNKVAILQRFNRPSFAGGSFEVSANVAGPTGYQRVTVFFFSSDYSDADRAGKIQVGSNNSANAAICRLVTPSGFIDGEDHTMFYQFDGDAGTATFRIDGTDVDDTGNADRIAPTTGTLDTGASSTSGFGASGIGASKFNGLIGFCGYRDASGLAWSDFMQTDGSPKNIEATLNTVWGGGAPLFWHESGKMDESATAMTKNGTITLAVASSWS